jgi:3-oxoacyl-[acyl-carrier protein] reductase
MSEREVALITGARKGIGRHLAHHFASCGYTTVGCSRSEVDWELDGYEHFTVDVTDELQVRDLMRTVEKNHGRLDVLVNNAGIASMNHSLLTPLSTARGVMETNFLGTFLACREAARVMKKNGYGRIVNVSTVAVPMRLEGESVYAASKSAVATYTQVLARELAPYGITCNVVAPGPVETDLIKGVPPDKIEKIVLSQAVKRLGTFEDVANVIDFFVSPRSDFVTGQVIYLGGV